MEKKKHPLKENYDSINPNRLTEGTNYKKYQADIKKELALTAKFVDKFVKQANPNHWSDDLGYVLTKLKEVNTFIGNTGE